MAQPCSVTDREQVADTMIALTRLSSQHRVIVAGRDSMALYLLLRRRGFAHVATPATCWLPKTQDAVALVSSQKSMAATEATLAQASRFLSDNAAIAVLIDARDEEMAHGIRRQLVQMDFRIEAGVRCRQGFVLSAYRQGSVQMAK